MECTCKFNVGWLIAVLGNRNKIFNVEILADITFTASSVSNKIKFYATCAAILQKSVISKSALMMFLPYYAMSMLVYGIIAV